MSPCPSRSDLQDLLAERLPPDRERLLLAHVDACPACQETLEELTAACADLSTTTPGAAGRPPGVPSPKEESFWQGLKAAFPGGLLSLPSEPASGGNA